MKAKAEREDSAVCRNHVDATENTADTPLQMATSLQDVPDSDDTALQGVCCVRPGQARGSFHTAYVEQYSQGRPNLYGMHEQSELWKTKEMSRLLHLSSTEGRVLGSRMEEPRRSSLQGVRAKTPKAWNPISLH